MQQFIGVYPDSKTLRFKLIPIGRTLEMMEKNAIIQNDTKKYEGYKRLKKIIDEYHKAFMDHSLKDLYLEGLEEYSELYNRSKRDVSQEKKYKELQANLRKQVINAIKKDPQFKRLFKKELITEDLYKFVGDNEEIIDLLQEFSEYTTYFTGFHQNRENMYTDEEKSTSIAYRLVNQNLPKYLDNIKIYELLMTSSVAEQVEGLEKELRSLYGVLSIKDYFTIDGFNLVLTQKGIDVYNTILGAYAKENGEKVQGLNEIINIYNQHVKEKAKRIPIMKELYKQILSDRDTVSFVNEKFESDEDVFEAIDLFSTELEQTIIMPQNDMAVKALLLNIADYDLKHIYINNDSFITTISKYLYGDWSCIHSAISDHYDALKGGKVKDRKYEEKKQKELKQVADYSISDLDNYVSKYKNESKKMEDYFTEQCASILAEIEKTKEKYLELSAHCKDKEDSAIRKDDKNIGIIKEYLDAIKKLQRLLKSLVLGQQEPDKDELFYGELIRIWDALNGITHLYNQVRNYVTQKPYSLEKIKINFEKSTLLAGWDKNKERDNLGVLLLKDGNYYLAIMDRKHNKSFLEVKAATSDVYQKMNYKLLPDPSKMLPKVFFSQKRIQEFAPGEEILQIRESGSFKKGDNFNLEDCHKLIDFYKASINKHEEWKNFGFSFSDTKDYADISGFYKEVSDQGYKITFEDVDADYIDRLVEEGKLYLFKIYCKDFSPYSTGKPNLHTMYWRALFDEENLKDIVYKLNGQAEVFYRKASIPLKITHPANEPIHNKDLNAKKQTSVFPYDLIKNRRYTCDQFQLHVPITMNFKASGENRFNKRVNQYIHDTKGMHVIGIDRGERNLLYICVIDENGKIVYQKSLNEIISCRTNEEANEGHCVDYHLLLDAREKQNKEARENWTTVNSIKELKEGYLSQVIHIITDLMIRYNAIVVLEDLNFGFMRGRQKFEKQVYQKFEKMLIDKLNYLVDKDKEWTEDGGVYRAYQLTDKFKSFQMLGKQSGFLFYIPAWMTSKIDPSTGFVNLFYTKYENMEAAKNFIHKFKRISYNEEKAYFEFEFDYKDFTYKADGTKTDWTVCSSGMRIKHFRDHEKNNNWSTKTIYLTDDFKELFDEYEVKLQADNMQDQLLGLSDVHFYKKFMELFSLMVQMRNSNEEGEDNITSPVLNQNGEFFCTHKNERGSDRIIPEDADANGAYNIAKKGVLIIEKIRKTDVNDLDKVKLAISNKEWLQYAQEHIL